MDPVRAAADGFRTRFSQEPLGVSVAPGRVNLIGEHTDYSLGLSLPAAIDRWAAVAWAPTEGQSQLVSADFGAAAALDLRLASPESAPSDWSRCPAGTAWALRQAGEAVGNVLAFVVSTVPYGAGVSSSAALEMAFAQLFAPDLAPIERAKAGQRCENEFIGARTGLMDQAVSVLAQENHALLSDFRELTFEPVPIPAHWRIVVCHTGVHHEIAASAYNERRAECEEACRLLGVPFLREATLDQARSLHGRLQRRAVHVVSEIERTVRCAQALREGDAETVGLLMRLSHESLRDDFEVTCRELDVLAELAWGMPEVIGCRMTGGGFGGACVALVPAATAEVFCEDIASAYMAAVGTKGQFFIARAAGPAHIVWGA